MMQPASPRHGSDTEGRSELSERILEELKQHIGERNLANWFRGRSVLELVGDELRVGVGSPFLLNWMQRHFREELQATAVALLGPSGRVRLEVDPRVALETATAPSPAAALARSQAAVAKPARTHRRMADLAEFIPGDGNKLALAAAGQVCDCPGTAINPLYIHGNVGVGKTHLLEGICRRVKRLYPSLQVTSLTAEQFTNFFTAALRDKTTPSFRQKFRNVDVLLVDDIDFLDAKKVVQAEFLHTLKQLESLDRQIVLTGDRHPRLLGTLSEELTSRFLSGLVCRVEPPDLAARREIVRRLAHRMPADFTDEALAFVAKRFRYSVRELKGALYSLQSWYQLSRSRIGVTAARKILADLERDCIRIVGLSDIEKAVCTMFGLPADELRSPRRTRSVSQPRMLAMFLARKHTQAAYSEIGEYFGGRNHSTVMSAERKVKGWLEEDDAIRVAAESWPVTEVVESLEQQLLAG